MILAKPPIVGDVAELIGSYAEKVENRSLLLNKFPIHKRWPVDPYEPDRKWDDASRWSFIRVAENGSAQLDNELRNRERVANGRNTQEPKRRKAEAECEIIRHLKNCACRRLDPNLSNMRKNHVEQFVALFSAHPERHIVLIGKLRASLAVNLSDSLIQNAGICLDRLFGEPCIPGSAVKGVSRHVALSRLKARRMSISVFQQLFGTADVDFSKGGDLADYAEEIAEEHRNRKGGFDFFAACPMGDVQVAVDMTNVHYPEYYASGNVPDLAKESPRPNPFPVTKAGVNFAFCVARNGMPGDSSLVETMRDLVREALETQGVGAKTGAGYGWFDCSETERWAEEKKRKQEESARKDAIAVLSARIAALAAMDAALPEFSSEIAEIEGHPMFSALPSKDREELVRQRRRLPQLSPLEVMRNQWSKAGANSVIGLPLFARKLNIVSANRAKAAIDQDMKDAISLLREPNGIGAEVWALLKRIAEDGKRKSKYKHIPNVVGTIRELCKNKLELGRMP